jgi:hypothetical protein
MSIRLHLPDRSDKDVSGQNGIYVVFKVVAHQWRVKISMKVLLPCVDACIGAAAASDLNILTKELLQLFLDDLLNTCGVGLYLPPMIVCSFI